MIYGSDYYVGSVLNGDSLSHHGVPNQKWGVKNGPPYPIQRGHDVRYNVGKMTPSTRSRLEKAGKIAQSTGKSIAKGVKTAGSKAKSSFTRWKESKKEDLMTKPTDSALLKSWQKKQLRISDMSNQELKDRIERKRLEEGYRRALRGDFTESKNWKGNSKNDDGKKAADSILKKVGNAAVAGLAKGLENRISNKITEKGKRKVERREARKDAMAKVATNAAKEREEYRANQRNEDWRRTQERRRAQRYDDGAMDPISGWARRNSPFAGAGLYGGSNSYTMRPDEWTIT